MFSRAVRWPVLRAARDRVGPRSSSSDRHGARSLRRDRGGWRRDRRPRPLVRSHAPCSAGSTRRIAARPRTTCAVAATRTRRTVPATPRVDQVLHLHGFDDRDALARPDEIAVAHSIADGGEPARPSARATASMPGGTSTALAADRDPSLRPGQTGALCAQRCGFGRAPRHCAR